MKILKISTEGIAEYTTDGTEYKVITEINKSNIYILIQLIMDDFENEITMDNFEDNTINNEAQKIIYSDLYIKLSDLLVKKSGILLEIDNEIQTVLSKYNLDMGEETDEV